MNKVINNFKYTYHKYGFLLQQLVSRDFKVKYKRSVLGVFWSLLYPVLMMAVMAIVFSNVFKFSTPGVSYLAFLQIGLTYFNYFSEASNLAMSSVVANFGLINKVYLPKYIFPFSKCVFVGINFLLTLIPLYAVILLTGTGLCWWHLLLPFSFLCLFMFTVGMGFILSTIAVFLRDMFYIYGIIITIWTYLTPIMYDLTILNPTFAFVLKFNPLYQYINFARTIILYHNCPTLGQFAGCFISALVVFVIGIVVFKKKQDKCLRGEDMKDNIMIEVNDVSMRFNLGIEKGFSLKQGFVDLFNKEKRKNKKKNEFWALKDVDFKVNKGEVVGFIGSNGAGKSTLLKAVAGVMKPTKGCVKAYGNICPMIELGAGFDMDLTARENIYLNGAVMGYSKELIDAKFNDIVEFSELHEFLDVPVKNFSSGMVARLAFSVATIVEPEILIVDEILSVGDIAFQAKSEAKMRSMIGGGTTVLFVSHSIEQIKKMCDRVIWIEHGVVQKIGGKAVCDEYVKFMEGK